MQSGVCQLKLVNESWFKASGIRSAQQRREIITGMTAGKDFLTYGKEYYDGNPGLGYGGYNCDGRFEKSVERIIKAIGLAGHSTVVELGCAKGCILLEFYKAGITDIKGFDISEYAITKAPNEIREKLCISSISQLMPIQDSSIDFLFSKDTLPHLNRLEIDQTLLEINRVVKDESSTCYLELAVASSAEVIERTTAWDPTHITLKPIDWWKYKLSAIRCSTYLHFKELM